ncbi:MAG: replication factor C large subunit [Candidatus Aenigmarchaeota archaeon]|nr:replication factor C large subunit [Candidatus Aenigmarchaeota archaeon]
MSLLEKYRSLDLRQFIGNSKAVQDVLMNISKKPILLHGAPGVGKTLLAHLVAKKLNYDLYEVNASDYRDQESMKRLANIAKQTTLFGKKRLILVDEVDGMSGTDRGGITELIKVLKDHACPTILTANDAYDKKLQSLRSYVLLVPFTKINYLSIAKHLREICQKEGAECDEQTLKGIAQRSNGSVRSAVNDMESLIVEGKLLDLSYLSERDTEENIFDLVKVILKTRKIDVVKSVVKRMDRSPEDLFWWIEENACREYAGEDLRKALEWLALADIYRKRIMKRQDWNLLKYYIDFITIGVALSKKEMYQKYIPYGFPTYVTKMGGAKKSAEEQEELAEMARKMHTSKHVISEEMPYLKQFINK